MLNPIAPGPDTRGALLSGAETTMTRYLVKYRILPPGVGPDDYEPADLVLREEEFELSDPESAGPVAGKELRVGPPIHEIQAAVSARLADGELPIVLRCTLL